MTQVIKFPIKVTHSQSYFICPSSLWFNDFISTLSQIYWRIENLIFPRYKTIQHKPTFKEQRLKSFQNIRFFTFLNNFRTIFCRDHHPLEMGMRPTQHPTSLDRLGEPRAKQLWPPTRRQTPFDFNPSQPAGTRLGPVSRLEALIETRSPSTSNLKSKENKIIKSEIKFSQIVVPSKTELKSRVEINLQPDDLFDAKDVAEKFVRTTEFASVNESESPGDDLKQDSILLSTKSVPNLVEIVDRTFDRHVSAFRNIHLTNFSVSLPFDLNEVSNSDPRPCEVSEYDDFFTLDQTVLQLSQRRKSNANALRYRSSIRIMVRPEASSAVSANPETSTEFPSNKIPPSVPIRSIVKEQFR